MRIAFVADIRSPIARGWIEPFIEAGHAVHVISTFPGEPPEGLASFAEIPVAFAGSGRGVARGSRAPGGAKAIGLRSALRHWLGPFTLPGARRRLLEHLSCLDLDLLHALRIPFEGMLAAAAAGRVPLVLSVWGNDFTLHAGSSPAMAALTRQALKRADALFADCARDLRLARLWGFSKTSSTLVVPGGGGVDRAIFRPEPPSDWAPGVRVQAILDDLPPDAPVVINPRGFRGYVRNDTFFRAVPMILEAVPETHFLCVGMQGEAQAERWLPRIPAPEQLHLLPQLKREELADLYRRAQVTVSPSEHDGTPNTFLEAIACGCFPVVGELESLREWVKHGVNGALIDPGDPRELARAVTLGLQDGELRRRAAQINQAQIESRAERRWTFEQAQAFYARVLGFAGKGP